jgi:hypothetical protein
MATFVTVAKIEAPTLSTTPGVDEMVQDWQVVPFTDVVAGTNDAVCPVGYEPMFTNLWKGTVHGLLL